MTKEVSRALVVAIVAWLGSGCKSEDPPSMNLGIGGGAGGSGAGGTIGGAPAGGSSGMSGAGGMSGAAGMSGMGGMLATAGTPAPGGMPAPAGMGGAATAGSSGAAGEPSAGAGGTPAAGPGLKPVDSIAMDGPYMPMVEQNVDGGDGWLFRPGTLGADGEKHPILVWGCGSGSTPTDYMFHLSRIASHGFVIYAANTSSVTGARLTQGLDWLFAENERAGGDLNGKLDLTNVAVGGHSLGSLSTYQIADDPRLTNTIHVDGGTFDATGGALLMKPAIFICGETSTGAEPCAQDYEDANVPIFFTRIMGLAGIQGHIAAAREGIDIWIAWMRWQMAHEEERRADFLDPNCTFCMGKWISLQKNW